MMLSSSTRCCFTSNILFRRQAKEPPDRASSKKFDLDLSDWVGHRVLARRGGSSSNDAPGGGTGGAGGSAGSFLCPGVVRGVYEGYSVSVLFDGEDRPLVYHEVIAPANLDVIVSDSVPATNQVRLFLLFLKLVLPSYVM